MNQFRIFLLDRKCSFWGPLDTTRNRSIHQFQALAFTYDICLFWVRKYWEKRSIETWHDRDDNHKKQNRASQTSLNHKLFLQLAVALLFHCMHIKKLHTIFKPKITTVFCCESRQANSLKNKTKNSTHDKYREKKSPLQTREDEKKVKHI